VRCEHKAPTAQLIAHLAEVGHRRIGMVLAMDGLSATVERVRRYRAGLRAAGLPEDGELIADGGPRRPCRGDGFAAGARRHADRAGERQQLHAIGILRALEARGLHVPDDLALVALRSTLRVRGPVAAAADRPAGARR
jgi:LacI family transcriptional regulator, galactose operon repressor